MAYDPYEQLGLKNGATDEEIRIAYKKLCQIHHPDKNLDDPYAETRFKLIKEAYEILMDPDRRARALKGENTAKFDPMPGALGQIVQALNEEMSKQGFRKLIAHMRTNLQLKLQTHIQALSHGDLQLEGLDTALTKFEFHGDGMDIITHGIQDNIKKIEAAVIEAQNGRDTVQLAVEILAGYEDIADLQLEGYGSSTSPTGSTTWT